METIYIGIDPGKEGGYTVIDGNYVRSYPWDDALFASDMNGVKCLADLDNRPIVAAVEKVGAMHGQGVTSMFSFGKSAGFIEGVLTAHGIPYQLIPPATWKREFSLIGKDKKASIEVCRKLFPRLDLKRTERCKTYSDGKAEATLIAEYARRKMR